MLTCKMMPLVQHSRNRHWWHWIFVILWLLNGWWKMCVWRHPYSFVGSFGNLNRFFVLVLLYLGHRLVELKCDVFYDDVLMDIWKDFILLVSNEHELFLVISIMKPIKAHVCSFGYAMYNCVSDDYVGENVVRLKWCCTLDVAHFM